MALRRPLISASGRTQELSDSDGICARTPVTTLGVTGSVSIDCSLGNAFLLSAPTGNVTLSISNAPASGLSQTIAIKFVQHGTTARTVTWPSSFKWPGGTAFVVSTATGAVDFIVATTMDGGTTWQAAGAKAHA
jgi:hypothetical protein